MRMHPAYFSTLADDWSQVNARADGWSVFDMVIVSVSVALLAVGTGGGNSWIKQLRVLRAFRLFRLLGKLGDLKKIVTAVAMSIGPTLQALVRMLTFAAL